MPRALVRVSNLPRAIRFFLALASGLSLAAEVRAELFDTAFASRPAEVTRALCQMRVFQDRTGPGISI
ncbi:MAG: hypothetical protein EXQ96_01435 [Alphaproteobacteria bacterium]|nr:hypothetical protein [Alphaproteobacteria bacterium]